MQGSGGGDDQRRQQVWNGSNSTVQNQQTQPASDYFSASTNQNGASNQADPFAFGTTDEGAVNAYDNSVAYQGYQQPEILYYVADDGNTYAYYYDENGNVVYPDYPSVSYDNSLTDFAAASNVNNYQASVDNPFDSRNVLYEEDGGSINKQYFDDGTGGSFFESSGAAVGFDGNSQIVTNSANVPHESIATVAVTEIMEKTYQQQLSPEKTVEPQNPDASFSFSESQSVRDPDTSFGSSTVKGGAGAGGSVANLSLGSSSKNVSPARNQNDNDHSEFVDLDVSSKYSAIEASNGLEFKKAQPSDIVEKVEEPEDLDLDHLILGSDLKLSSSPETKIVPSSNPSTYHQPSLESAIASASSYPEFSNSFGVAAEPIGDWNHEPLDFDDASFPVTGDETNAAPKPNVPYEEEKVEVYNQTSFEGNNQTSFEGNNQTSFEGNNQTSFDGNNQTSFDGNKQTSFEGNNQTSFEGNSQTVFDGNMNYSDNQTFNPVAHVTTDQSQNLPSQDTLNTTYQEYPYQQQPQPLPPSKSSEYQEQTGPNHYSSNQSAYEEVSKNRISQETYPSYFPNNVESSYTTTTTTDKVEPGGAYAPAYHANTVGQEPQPEQPASYDSIANNGISSFPATNNGGFAYPQYDQSNTANEAAPLYPDYESATPMTNRGNDNISRNTNNNSVNYSYGQSGSVRPEDQCFGRTATSALYPISQMAPTPLNDDQMSEISDTSYMSYNPMSSEVYQLCHRCKRKNPMDCNFCGQCGNRLSGRKITPPVPAQPSATAAYPDAARFLESSTPTPINSNTPQPLPTIPLKYQPPGSSLAREYKPQPISMMEEPKKKDLYPIATFGFGGKLVLIFPRKQERYDEYGNKVLKYFPGMCRVQSIKDLSSPKVQEALIAPFKNFKGPLQPKVSKPKEILQFLDSITTATTTPTFVTKENPYIAIIEAVRYLVEFSAIIFGEDGNKGKDAIIKFLNMKSSISSSTSSSSSGNQMPPSQMTDECQYQLPVVPACANLKLKEISEHLLLGNRSQACEIAVSQELWAHALLISSQIDTKTYFGVVSKFATQTCPIGSPIRFLFLSLGGKNKTAVSELIECMDAKTVSRWKDTLTMILSNNLKDELGIIKQFCEGLYAKGFFVESQLCLLLGTRGREAFDGFDGPLTGRLSLLGLDRKDIRSRLISNPLAFQLTEIVENGLRVSNPSFHIPHLHALKIVYAHMLLDVGLAEEALGYCQMIGANLKTSKTPSPYIHRHLFEVLGSLNDRLIKSGTASSTANAADNSEISSWLTKGLMDVFDRGLNKVMGVDSGTTNTMATPVITTSATTSSVMVSGKDPSLSSSNNNTPKKVQSETNLMGMMNVSGGALGIIDGKRSGSNQPPPIANFQPPTSYPVVGSNDNNNNINTYSSNNSYGAGTGTGTGYPNYYNSDQTSSYVNGYNASANASIANASIGNASIASNGSYQANPPEYYQSQPTYPITTNNFSKSKSTLVNSSHGSISQVNLNNNYGFDGDRRASNGSNNASVTQQVISNSNTIENYYPLNTDDNNATNATEYFSSDANSTSVSYVSPDYNPRINDNDESKNFEDDLGLGNKSLSVNSSSGAGVGSGTVDAGKNTNQQSDSNDNSSDSNARKPGASSYFSLLTGWFSKSGASGGASGGPSATTGPDGKKVYRMNLGEENNMIYDSVSKRWIVKGSSSVGPSLSATPAPGSPAMGNIVAPPPSMPSFAPSPLLGGGGSSSSSSNSNQFRRGNLRGARNKYIDTLNPTSSTAPSPALGARIPPPPTFGGLADFNGNSDNNGNSSSRRNSSGNNNNNS